MGGRINSNIGLPEEGLTLTNCFILPTNDDPDSLASIMDTLKDFVLTLKSEGGVGFCADFFRPANTLIKGVGVTTPGAVKFLEGFDKMSDIITAGGVDKNNSFQGIPTKNSIRKGAMMITMSINHPDIEDFIIVKSTPNKLTRCNMSVLVSDKFIKTVEEDGDWDLWFPDIRSKEYEQWNGDMLKWEAEGYSKVIYKTVKARDLWELLLKNCFNRNEPGILFIDNIRKMDNLAYLNECSITCTNPCLPSWATVLTPEGISTIGKIKQGDLIWSEDGWVKVINKQSSGIKDVYEYGTSSTDSFSSTKEHRISSNNKKIEIDKAISIDKFQKEGDNYVRNCLSCDIKNKKYISTEEVFDITVNGNHHTFWCNGYNVFNCGEVPSSTGKINNELVGDICNLGSINLTKFYNIETRKFDVEDFLNSAELMVKALDRIIDISKYPLPLYERGAKLKRKVGVGLMGIGSLAMMMNMRYGSQEHLYFLEDLLSKYINKLYQTSALLAKEYGPFAVYDPDLIDIGFVANSGVLWDETVDLIKKYGLRNSALSAIAPNGCLVDDTLIPTSEGCVKINNFGDISNSSPISLTNDINTTRFKAWYDMGYDKTIKVTTKKGFYIEGTPQHKIRTIKSGGKYEWKELKDINTNDIVVLKKGFLSPKENLPYLKEAELLGAYMADGWISGNRLYFQINLKQKDYIKSLLFECFNEDCIKIIERTRGEKNTIRLEINSKKIKDWFIQHNYIKKGSSGAFIPDAVLTSNKTSILGFIRGYFKGDGGFNVSKQNIRFTSVSDTIISQLQVLLLGLGIISFKYIEKVKGEKVIIGGRGTKHNFDTVRLELSCYNSRKLCKLLGIDYTCINTKYQGRNFEVVPLQQDEINKFKETNYVKFFKDLDIPCVTSELYKTVIPLKDRNWFVKNDLTLDYIIKKENSLKQKHVQDISVYGNSHSYVANGFITHNTLSILAGNVSGGVEPVFDKEFYRWNRVEEKVDFEYPKVSKGEWFETDYFKEQTTGNETILMSKDNKYRIDKNVGLCKQIKIEDYGYKIAKQRGYTNTATAKELSIDEHLKVLALFSKYCDQSISKTISLPKDLSFEQFKELYKEIYKYGIKGCTVYREGTSVAILESQKANVKKSVKKQQKEFLEAFKDQSDKVAINVKLPDEYPSKGYILRSEGKKWYLHVAFKDKACTRPFALFVNTNAREDNISTFNALDNLIELAKVEGLDNALLLETEKKIVNQKNPVKVCRMLGFLLRHNVNIYKIVKALDNVEEAVVGTFIHRIKKFLSQFIEEINEMNKCPYCGENSLVFREGCFICLQCGMSKC
jgi:ribonucleotide reductase alpha subunit